MSEGRGMKKWAPFKSLVEQTDHLRSLQKRKDKIEKPLISNDRAVKINEILEKYHGQDLLIKYFENGTIFEVKTTIKSIDIYEHILTIENGIKIDFNGIVDIDDSEFNFY